MKLKFLDYFIVVIFLLDAIMFFTTGSMFNLIKYGFTLIILLILLIGGNHA